MNPSDQMIVGNCSFCSGIVRIPVDVKLDTAVRCPHCSETSRLGTILEAAVPQLEILDDIDQADLPKQTNSFDIRTDLEPAREKGSKFEVSPILSKGAKRPRHRNRGEKKASRDNSRSNRSSSSDRQANESAAEPLLLEGQPDNTSGGRVSNDSRQAQPQPSQPRRKRSSRSKGNLEIVKVVIGALLAFPVAQLMIWWWVDVDPLNIGPSVGQVIPAVVPAQFRGEAEEKNGLFDADLQRQKREKADPETDASEPDSQEAPAEKDLEEKQPDVDA